MNSDFLASMVKWLGISLAVGIGFQIIWAVVFWDNDNLFIYHWLAVPLSTVTMLVGAIRSLKL